MKALMLLAVSLFSFSSVASLTEVGFAGNWLGKGTYILNGDLTQCSEMRMQFFADEQKFVFVGGGRVCDKHEESFYQVVLQYRDGQLFFNGQVVGSYSENEMRVFFTQPEGDGRIRHWRMGMRVEGDHLMYEENRRMDNDATPMISFAGMLQRQ